MWRGYPFTSESTPNPVALQCYTLHPCTLEYIPPRRIFVPLMPHALDIVHTSTHILDDVQYAGSPQELEQAEIPHAIGDELSMQDVKISSSHNESSRRNSLHSEQAIDNASVHSLPVAHVTDPEPPTNRRPSTARGAESSVPPRSLSSLSRSQTSQEGMPMPESHRRLRHRSGAEVGDDVCPSHPSPIN